MHPGHRAGVKGDAGPEREDLDSEALLAQGDELLRSSRRLLEEIDDTIDLRDPPSGA